MSRLSRANLKARESIFTSGSSIHRADSVAQCPPDLEECVAAIEDCCEEVLNTFTSSSDNSSDSDTQMREAQKLLRNGTRDHPRIMKVLKNERARRRILVDLVLYWPLFQVFLLVNEDTIRKYKADLADEVEPTIVELIERAEDGLRTLERKEALLKSKVTLWWHFVEGIDQHRQKLENAHAQPNQNVTASQKMEARRLQLLKKQRERLENDVRVLEEEIILLVSHIIH